MHNATLVYGVTYHGSTPEPLKGLDNSYGKHVCVSRLREHLKWYQQHFNVFSLGEILKRVREDLPLPENSLFIVFHDGYRGSYDIAFPMLKDFGLKATFFIATDFIGTNNRFWVDLLDAALKYTQIKTISINQLLGETTLNLQSLTDRQAASSKIRKHLKNKPIDKFNELFNQLIVDLGFAKVTNIPMLGEHEAFINWEMAREMTREGMEFGSHTHRHVICAHQDDETVKEEMEISKKVLEREIGQPCDLFCYPNGNYPSDGNDATDRLAFEAGYTNVLYMVGPYNYLNRKSFRLTGISYGETSDRSELSRSLSEMRFIKKRLLGLRIWPWDKDSLED